MCFQKLSILPNHSEHLKQLVPLYVTPFYVWILYQIFWQFCLYNLYLRFWDQYHMLEPKQALLLPQIECYFFYSNTIQNIISKYLVLSFAIQYILIFFSPILKVYLYKFLKKLTFKTLISISLKHIGSNLVVIFGYLEQINLSFLKKNL